MATTRRRQLTTDGFRDVHMHAKCVSREKWLLEADKEQIFVHAEKKCGKKIVRLVLQFVGGCNDEIAKKSFKCEITFLVHRC